MEFHLAGTHVLNHPQESDIHIASPDQDKNPLDLWPDFSGLDGSDIDHDDSDIQACAA